MKKALKTGEPGVVRRTQIIVNAAAGRSAVETADAVGCAKSTVYDTLNAFAVQGRLALLDGRRGNGSLKATDDFRRTVRCLLDQSPRDYDYFGQPGLASFWSRSPENRRALRSVFA